MLNATCNMLDWTDDRKCDAECELQDIKKRRAEDGSTQQLRNRAVRARAALERR